MNVCFRCDANSTIGFGHFYRCLSLADALSELAISCTFLMENAPKSIISIIKESAHRLLNCTVDESTEQLAHVKNAEKWIITLQRNNVTCNLLIVDYYKVEQQWITIVKPSVVNVMILNDSGKKWRDVDIIWDASSMGIKDYQPISSSDDATTFLLGPQYSLLRKEFQNKLIKTPCNKLSNTNNPFQLLITIGATDPLNTTKKLLKWLQVLIFDIQINVLSTSANVHIKNLITIYNDKPVNFFIDRTNIAEIMSSQDLIITAAGNMMWEAFSLGKPCAILNTCDNQTRNVALVTGQMRDVYLGKETDLDELNVVHLLHELVNDSDKLSLLSLQALNICDGQGANKTAKIIANEIQK